MDVTRLGGRRSTEGGHAKTEATDDKNQKLNRRVLGWPFALVALDRYAFGVNPQARRGLNSRPASSQISFASTARDIFAIAEFVHQPVRSRTIRSQGEPDSTSHGIGAVRFWPNHLKPVMGAAA